MSLSAIGPAGAALRGYWEVRDLPCKPIFLVIYRLSKHLCTYLYVRPDRYVIPNPRDQVSYRRGAALKRRGRYVSGGEGGLVLWETLLRRLLLRYGLDCDGEVRGNADATLGWAGSTRFEADGHEIPVDFHGLRDKTHKKIKKKRNKEGIIYIYLSSICYRVVMLTLVLVQLSLLRLLITSLSAQKASR